MAWHRGYKRKTPTHTSTEVKDRWNARHYDQIQFRTGTGGREAIQAMAELRGKSMAEYLRGLVIADAHEAGKDDISAILGGGGNLLKFLADCCKN